MRHTRWKWQQLTCWSNREVYQELLRPFQPAASQVAIFELVVHVRNAQYVDQHTQSPSNGLSVDVRLEEEQEPIKSKNFVKLSQKPAHIHLLE